MKQSSLGFYQFRKYYAKQVLWSAKAIQLLPSRIQNKPNGTELQYNIIIIILYTIGIYDATIVPTEKVQYEFYNNTYVLLFLVMNFGRGSLPT